MTYLSYSTGTFWIASWQLYCLMVVCILCLCVLHCCEHFCNVVYSCPVIGSLLLLYGASAPCKSVSLRSDEMQQPSPGFESRTPKSHVGCSTTCTVSFLATSVQIFLTVTSVRGNGAQFSIIISFASFKEVIAWVLKINDSMNFFHFCIFCCWKWI
jgi:hypothetical protein